MSLFVCPHCGYRRSWKLRRNKFKCKSCRRESARTQPVAAGIRADSRAWRACIRVFLRERTAKRVQQEAAVGRNNAQRMTSLLRHCMEQDVPDVFVGPVEMDETYIGGQRKNKRLHIRRIQGKRGHGTDKLPIVGIVCRVSAQAYVEVLEKKLDVYKIMEILQHRVTRGATIYTDGFKMYRMLPRYGFVHEYVDHLQGEYVRADAHTNHIEGFWGILKRKLSCIGGMRRQYLHLFVAEIVWKYNNRNLTLTEQEEKLYQILLKFGGRT